MMRPVAGLGDFDETAMLHGGNARIVFRHGSKAFQSPEEQSGRSDLAVDLRGVCKVVAKRANGASVVVATFSASLGCGGSIKVWFLVVSKQLQ
jgi:hypothetical protein